MADPRFNYSFQTALGTHPLSQPPPPQWGGGGLPFPAAALGDYRIYNSTTHLFLPYTTYHVLPYYQFQDFSSPPRQAQQHYYNTRSTYSNVHNSDGNRVQFEDETVILDGSLIHRQQQHARDHRDHQRVVDNIQRSDNQNNNTGLSEDQIARCLEIKNKNLRRYDHKEEESEVCAICLDDLCRSGNNRNVGSLECKHQYHLDCITRWLRVKNFCPLCKAVAFHQDAR